MTQRFGDTTRDAAISVFESLGWPVQFIPSDGNPEHGEPIDTVAVLQFEQEIYADGVLTGRQTVINFLRHVITCAVPEDVIVLTDDGQQWRIDGSAIEDNGVKVSYPVVSNN